MAELKIKADSGGGTVSFKGPATTTSNAAVQLTLPVDDGTSGQYLKTDGSGTLSWATVAVGGATGTDYNDSVKARFGTGNDLEIYHDGSHSNIKDAGSGQLNFWSNVYQFYNAAGSETLIKATENGAVELYHDNTKQCETSANGLAFPSGKGVDFSATANASTTGSSMTSELLDWYEEGSWTPSITFGGTSNFVGGTHNVQWGTYTRVGRLVTASGTIGYSAKGSSSGLVNINGLPFTSGGSTHRCGGWANYSNFFSTETDNSTVQLYLGDTRTNMECLHDSQDNLNASDCNSAGQMNFTVIYQV